MDVDWLADVRKYVPDADEGVVGKIVKYCGIALRTPNAASVTFSDPTETGRVRDNYLKKKLGLTQDDAALDGAIAAVGERMGVEDGYRVTVYYLLAEHFGLLDTFGGTKGGGGAAAAATTAAATTAAAATTSATASTASTTAASTAPAAETPINTAMSSTGGHSPTRPTRGGGGGGSKTGNADSDDMFGIGCVAGLVALGAIILAALIGVWAQSTILTADPEEETTAAAPAEPAPAPAPEPVAEPAPEPEVPEGAGATATERDGKPLLSVYFDSGSTDVTPDFEQVSTDIRAYLDANPDATVAISGFNDPTGNAELNAELSKNRAENVQAALVALGIDEARTDLVKPDDTTSEELSNAEARRVEISVVE